MYDAAQNKTAKKGKKGGKQKALGAPRAAACGFCLRAPDASSVATGRGARGELASDASGLEGGGRRGVAEE